MDKDNFIIEPYLDPFKEVSIQDLFKNHDMYLKASEQLQKDREKLIKQFEEYKKRSKGE